MAMSKYQLVTTGVSIVPTKGNPTECNPIFGERAIRVSLRDEGGGPFLAISSDLRDCELELELEELEQVLQAAKILIGIPSAI